MTSPFAPIPRDAELDALLKHSAEIVVAVTPEERGAMHKAQCRSWVLGEHMLEHPEVSRADAEALVDRVMIEGGLS